MAKVVPFPLRPRAPQKPIAHTEEGGFQHGIGTFKANVNTPEEWRPGGAYDTGPRRGPSSVFHVCPTCGGNHTKRNCRR